MGYKVGWFVLRFLGVANVGMQFHWGLNHADVKSANLAGINLDSWKNVWGTRWSGLF